MDYPRVAVYDLKLKILLIYLKPNNDACLKFIYCLKEVVLAPPPLSLS